MELIKLMKIARTHIQELYEAEVTLASESNGAQELYAPDDRVKVAAARTAEQRWRAIRHAATDVVPLLNTPGLLHAVMNLPLEIDRGEG
jgi:hypothetical protein